MTQIVPVAPGFSEVVASGPQYGVKYVLTGMQGDGARITFNDPQDADHVGYLSNISGLDSPELRESADDLIGDDGGVHGNFFHGRRPVVLEGMIDNRPGVTDYKLVPAMVLSDWVATDVAGCALWTPADRITGKVNADAMPQYDDQSGNARHFTQATGSLQPTYRTNVVNGLPVVRFDATDDRMSATIPADATVTVFIVAKLAGSTSNTYDLLTFNNNFSTARLGNSTGNWVWSQNQAAANVTVGGPNTNWNVVTLRFNSVSSAEAFFNGGAATSFDPNDTYSTQTSLVIGSTSWAVNSDVAEIILYDSALSNADVDTVRNYLGAKYAIGFGSMPAQVLRSTQVQVPLDANVVRNKRMTALQRVTNAMRKDMQMRWQVEGGTEQMLNLRRQQPLRITGGFNKTFQAALVAADPRIYASAIQEVRMNVGVQTTVRNNGSLRTQPVATIFGPTSGTMTAIELHNHSTGEFFVFAPAYALAPGQYIVIDFANKTVTRESGLNIYDQVQFASTAWWQLEPSDNLIELHGTGTTTNANCVLRWQDAWV